MKAKTLLVFFFLLLFVSGCWSSHEINTLAISIATGLDRTEKGYLISQQVLNPKAISIRFERNEAPVVLFSQEGENLFSAVRKITLESPRKIYNSHISIIVFGEDMAKSGLKDALDFFIRDYEYRTDFYFIIAKGATANEVLKILTPLESIPGMKLHQSLDISENHWGLTNSTNIIELVQLILADGQNPVLPGIEITSRGQDSDNLEALKAVDVKKRLQYTSMGVFHEDKLIGWLSENEAKGYNYITGTVKNNIEYAYYNEKNQITFEVIRSDSKIIASCQDEKPSILVQIKAVANIAAIDGVMDISADENKKFIARLLEKRLNNLCGSALQKAQGTLCSDIFGFGEAIHRKYPELWKELKSDWSRGFPDLPVDFEITVEINQLGQIKKPMFRKEE